MSKLVVVETVEGEKLIGKIVPAPQNFVSQFSGIFPASSFDGIWLQRETRVSYLAKESIVNQRYATIFDKEIISS